MSDKVLGRVLKEIREKQRLTQAEAAEGWTRAPYLRDLEAGRGNIAEKHLRPWLRGLRVSAYIRIRSAGIFGSSWTVQLTDDVPDALIEALEAVADKLSPRDRAIIQAIIDDHS